MPSNIVLDVFSGSEAFHTRMREFIFAYNVDLLGCSVIEMQHIVGLFAATYTAFGFKIIRTKTKVTFISVTVKQHINPFITVHGTSCTVAEIFTYLDN